MSFFLKNIVILCFLSGPVFMSANGLSCSNCMDEENQTKINPDSGASGPIVCGKYMAFGKIPKPIHLKRDKIKSGFNTLPFKINRKASVSESFILSLRKLTERLNIANDSVKADLFILLTEILVFLECLFSKSHIKSLIDTFILFPPIMTGKQIIITKCSYLN